MIGENTHLPLPHNKEHPSDKISICRIIPNDKNTLIAI
tara:strand:+ start:506 stop:619 length:114 start_codon:yes stop_codon:yes gene_type:complete